MTVFMRCEQVGHSPLLLRAPGLLTDVGFSTSGRVCLHNPRYPVFTLLHGDQGDAIIPMVVGLHHSSIGSLAQGIQVPIISQDVLSLSSTTWRLYAVAGQPSPRTSIIVRALKLERQFAITGNRHFSIGCAMVADIPIPGCPHRTVVATLWECHRGLEVRPYLPLAIGEDQRPLLGPAVINHDCSISAADSALSFEVVITRGCEVQVIQ